MVPIAVQVVLVSNCSNLATTCYGAYEGQIPWKHPTLRWYIVYVVVVLVYSRPFT